MIYMSQTVGHLKFMNIQTTALTIIVTSLPFKVVNSLTFIVTPTNRASYTCHCYAKINFFKIYIIFSYKIFKCSLSLVSLMNPYRIKIFISFKKTTTLLAPYF